MYGTPKQKINNLILNYFIQEGYEEAAINFSRETGIKIELDYGHSKASRFPSLLQLVGNSNDKEFAELIQKNLANGGGKAVLKRASSGNDQTTNISARLLTKLLSKLGYGDKVASNLILQGYSTIQQRKQIKYLILKGDITKAIENITEYFPTILDRNNLLYFKLLRLNLIEMIRNHKLDNNMTNEKEKMFLNDILTFVRTNLINKVVHLQKLLKELEITMSLLCFSFDSSIKNIEEQKDLPEELRQLFNLSLRKKCYGLVNRAILNLSFEEENKHTRPATNLDGGVLFSTSQVEQLQKQLQNNNSINILKSEDMAVETDGPISGSKSILGDLEKKESGKDDVDMDEDLVEEDEYDDDDLKDIEDMDNSDTSISKLELESKLEKVIKLWLVTEKRLEDLNIIDT